MVFIICTYLLSNINGYTVQDVDSSYVSLSSEFIFLK